MEATDSITVSRVYAHGQTQTKAQDVAALRTIQVHLDLCGGAPEDTRSSELTFQPDESNDMNYASIAHKIHAECFQVNDTCQAALQAAIFSSQDDQLATKKFVFTDASFLVVRGNTIVPVDPRSGSNLWRYAKWVGYSVTECAAVVTLLNLLDAASPRAH